MRLSADDYPCRYPVLLGLRSSVRPVSVTWWIPQNVRRKTAGSTIRLPSPWVRDYRYSAVDSPDTPGGRVFEVRGGYRLTTVADSGARLPVAPSQPRAALTAVPGDTTLRGVRRTRTSRALCALFLALACTPCIGQAASIKGKVVVDAPVPPQKKIEVTIDQYVCGNEKEADDLQVSPQREIAQRGRVDRESAGRGDRAGAAAQGGDRPEGMRLRPAGRRSFPRAARWISSTATACSTTSTPRPSSTSRSTARSPRAGRSRSPSPSRRS